MLRANDQANKHNGRQPVVTAYERTKKIALEICELVGAGAIAYALIWIFVHYTVGIR